MTVTLQSFPAASVSNLKHLRIFQEVPARELASLDGKIRLAKIPEGETILDLVAAEEAFRYFFFISKGQVKAVGLDEDARVKPLNFLRKGEFFVDKAFAWRSQVATKMVALTEVELLILPREEVRQLTERYEPLREKIRGVAERVDYRNRIYSEDNYARSVLEFLVDNELTQASRVKITLLDKCIECNICYKSCEDRHGFTRLERGYARFGVLDFAKSCLTCFYPTCVPACPVDSVVFNSKKGEVEILDSCIGCTACAHACQYGAIRMYKVDDQDDRFGRFLQPGKKIKPKFVADKCNHCEGHEDMACIVNCPTGAIMEVAAADLLENPRIFGTGEGAQKKLPSLIHRSSLDLFLQRTEVVFGTFLILWLSWEAYALGHVRKLSLLVSFQEKGVIPASFDLVFERGSDLLNFLGNVGFTLIFIGMSYPLRKSFPRIFKYLGRQLLWLDFHNFCGILGTFLILLHTGFYFKAHGITVPGVLGFFFLLIVFLSGLFGRFLYAMIPRGVAGTELRMKEIEEEDSAISSKLETLFEEGGRPMEFINRVIGSITQDAAEAPSIWSMVKSVAKTWWFLIIFRFHIPKELRIHRRQTGVFLELLHDKIRLKRNAAFLGISSRLFMIWRYIHQPMAYMMTVFAIVHVIVYLVFNPKLRGN